MDLYEFKASLVYIENSSHRRRDLQVKHRGCRIELADIEQNLLALRREWPGLSIRPAEEIEEDFLILYQRKEENREKEVRYAAEGD